MVDTSFEIYVSENALLEVTKGPHLTVAQAYGTDWQSAPMVNVHPESMRALAEFHRTEQGKRSGPAGLVLTLVFVVGVMACAWLVLR